MDRIDIIELKETKLADNDADARSLREEMRRKGILYVNLMSSPGSGKTSVLMQTIRHLKSTHRIGVMEADIDSAVDAERIAQTGVKAVQLHTGGMCHLDADMSRQGLRALGDDGLDLVFLENVGNLVCPAEFDTGAALNVAILAVPEGDDKPLKYPLMFRVCDAVLINKMDSLPIFDFRLEKAREAILRRNPRAQIFPVSARTGEGFGPWCEFLNVQFEQLRGEQNG